MNHASKERYSAEGVNMKAEAIKATDEWYEQLQSMPFLSCKFLIVLLIDNLLIIEKKGKTLHLLKASSKKINPNRRRKIIPLLGSIKDFHLAS